MKPLEVNRRILTWLCVCPVDSRASKLKTLLHTLCCTITLAANFSGFAASITFFIKFVSSDLEQSLHALLQMCALGSATYMLVIALMSRHKVNAIFTNLLKIYGLDFKDGDSLEFLMQAEKKGQRFSNKYLQLVLIGFAVNTSIMATTSVLFCWIRNQMFDANYVYHPFQVLVPWDKQTFVGYIGEITFAITFGDSYLFSNCSLLLLFISICFYHQKFCERFSYTLKTFDHRDKNRNDAKHICQLIHFHNSIKEWFLKSADVYSQFLMIQLICNTVYLACVVFQLDLQLRHFSLGLIIFLISVMVGVSNLFLYCFFGKLATESYATMADRLYEANWRELSVDLQKYFVVMLGNAQRPVFYDGFGIAILNLETFSKLLKMVFTYYMMFKTLTSK